MDLRTLSTEILNGISHTVRGSTVAIWWRKISGDEEIGTGTLIKADSETYILTCHHVAQSFFARSTEEARCFRPDHLGQIERDQLTLHAMNEEDDTALLKLAAQVVLRERDQIITLDRFALVEDYSLIPREAATYVIPGYPAAMVVRPPNRKYPEFTHISYFTVQHEKQATEKRFLLLEYATGEEQDVHWPGTRTDGARPLMPAFGFSGSPVFIVSPLPSDKSIWKGEAYIIAVQAAVHRREGWVKCVPIRGLWNWIQQKP